MSPFDRVLMTCYSTLIETVRLSCAVFEAVVRRKSPIFLTHHTCIWHPVSVDPVEFRGDLRRQKTRFPAILFA